MKPFDLDEYKKNPSREVVTRDGHKARIICTDREGDICQIVALIQNGGKEIIQTYTELGYVIHGDTEPLDLFFASVKHQGWINIYKDALIYNTEEEARFKALGDCVATIQIEWVE